MDISFAFYIHCENKLIGYNIGVSKVEKELKFGRNWGLTYYDYGSMRSRDEGYWEQEYIH